MNIPGITSPALYLSLKRKDIKTNTYIHAYLHSFFLLRSHTHTTSYTMEIILVKMPPKQSQVCIVEKEEEEEKQRIGSIEMIVV